VRVGKRWRTRSRSARTEVGIEAKTFEQEGLEIVATSFRGDAQLQQALAAGGVDIGLGSGPGLGFRIKGAPAIGVAGMYGPPSNLALLVPINSPIKTIEESQGQARRRHHGRLAHRLAGARAVAPAGLGAATASRSCRSAPSRPASPPWSAASSTPRAGGGQRLPAREQGKTRNLLLVRQHREGFPIPT